MGNCIRHKSSTTWDESDQLFVVNDISNGGCCERASDAREVEEESLLGEKKGVSSTEVKIKITKKQLEELLGRVDIQGMSVEQLLTHLVDSGGDYQLRHRSWKPALQSIPEVD